MVFAQILSTSILCYSYHYYCLFVHTNVDDLCCEVKAEAHISALVVRSFKAGPLIGRADICLDRVERGLTSDYGFPRLDDYTAKYHTV